MEPETSTPESAPAATSACAASPPTVPERTKTYLDYALDAVVIISASVLLYLGVITDTQWTATVVAISAGRVALRVPGSGGGTPPSSGAVSALVLGAASILKDGVHRPTL